MTGEAGIQESTSRQASRASSEHFLRDITHSITESINRRNWNSSVWDNMSPDFVAQYEESRWTSGVTLQEHLHNLYSVTNIFPDSKASIIDLDVMIDDSNSQAQVNFILEIKNTPVGGPHVQYLYVMEWKKYGDEWKCTRHRGMAGMAGPSMVGSTVSGYL
ncbi:hypothetical protein CLAFUW4_14660 [Fulvia fulva]|uniref:Uncharacterized protein n=1 Tax=Passalora fulva TaxID=5499 RepID=A0A9Q8PMW9_PASFU|nr:uncharacterized protein CLAFUR5_14488 [Fulvia fulva]KAK4609332.1 hypothetical protein CLAFUR4_14654 [Fulvia fulva]KAK4609622.1 hypothetical protein CLAFUR0_14653 [Fulvia fulva]UJO25324.1 hypothetical protein CLAFUR5_14488 [Fulvia fulva]WPV22639.1 hypothetical protein CLAFUW4_14660 [Fulvia fulva]WPV37736.1 hypothetical protein CLAFUW7_14663 [Fulvia fulva]